MKVKIVLGNDIRRFVPKGDLSDSWGELSEFLAEHFGGRALQQPQQGERLELFGRQPKKMQFVLHYKDDEGDLVTVASEVDYQVALDSAREEKRKSLKLLLKPIEKVHGEKEGFSKARDGNQSTTHEGVTCDICKSTPIVGNLYKCSICHDLRMCESCESNYVNGSHTAHKLDHPTMKFREPANSDRQPAIQQNDRWNAFRRLNRSTSNNSCGWGRSGPKMHSWPSDNPYRPPYFQTHPGPHHGPRHGPPPGPPGPHHGPPAGPHSGPRTQNFNPYYTGQPEQQPTYPSTVPLGPPQPNPYAYPQTPPDGGRVLRTMSEPFNVDLTQSGADSMNWRREKKWEKFQKKQEKMQEKMRQKFAKKEERFIRKEERMKQKRMKAQFVSHVTVPPRSSCPRNTLIQKTWRFKNVGSYEWPDGCRLIFTHGDQLVGVKDGVDVPSCLPHQVVDVTVNIKTPDSLGRFVCYYRLCAPTPEGPANEVTGKKFGPKVWVDFFISDVFESDHDEELPPLERQSSQQNNGKKNGDGNENTKTGGMEGEGEPKSSEEQEMIHRAIEMDIGRGEDMVNEMNDLSISKSNDNIEGKYDNELSTLSAMGFDDEITNRTLLERFDGNVQQVISTIIQDKFGDRLDMLQK